MNIAFVSPHSTAHIADKVGWAVEGFRKAKENVRRVHTLEGLREADWESRLVIFDQYDAGLNASSIVEIAQHKRSTWFQWWRDLVAFNDEPLLKQIESMSLLPMMRAMDLCLVKERSLLVEYGECGISARFMDQACPPEMPEVDRNQEADFDVIVFGTYSREIRRRDAMTLRDAGLRVAWAGQPEAAGCPPGIEPLPWTHPFGLPALVSRAKVVLSVDHRVDLDGYCSDRVYLAAGMGACVARRKSPGMVDLPMFDYGDEKALVKLVRKLADDKKLRDTTGKAARKLVMAKHTYRDRADSILALYANDSGGPKDGRLRKPTKAAGAA